MPIVGYLEFESNFFFRRKRREGKVEYGRGEEQSLNLFNKMLLSLANTE